MNVYQDKNKELTILYEKENLNDLKESVVNHSLTYCNTKKPIMDVNENATNIKNVCQNNMLNDEIFENLGTNFKTEDAFNILRRVRINNVNKLMIGSLNINLLANKFDLLKEIISNHLDILILVETKLDDSFSKNQFLIPGYNKPYMVNININGGGVVIYIKENIPSKEVNKHKFTKKVEGLFIEVNLRKTKLLLFGSYHSTHKEYGLSDADYFEQISLALDVYSNYDKFLLAGDFNIEEEESCLNDFLHEHNAMSIVKQHTCFKNIDNPSCIDLFITNCYRSFQNTITVSTGLSDFHKMIVTVMKTTIPKSKPKIIQYRDYKSYSEIKFSDELKERLQNEIINDYDKFEDVFLEILNKHAPPKKKVFRANHKPYMTKALRKAIMKRSELENKYYREKSSDAFNVFKKHKNYTNKLIKKEKRRYFSNLQMNNFIDNKKFWNTVKPLFSNNDGGSQKITLVKDDKIISDDNEVAENFNDFFKNVVKLLDLPKNRFLINDTKNLTNHVDIVIKKFENHPSIINIKEMIHTDTKFSFWKIESSEIENEVKTLKTGKATIFLNIPVKQLKQIIEIIVEPLMKIWNIEIIDNKKFPSKLKCADLTPIFKKLECIFVENYRPISLLPVVSKIFERIMQKQLNTYVNEYLSRYLCGFRKGYNTQYALLSMIEKWKQFLDMKGHAAAILMDLSKAFDTINHELLIAKLEAYGFTKGALEIISSYLNDRWQRTKINTSFSTWSELLMGVPQG